MLPVHLYGRPVPMEPAARVRRASRPAGCRGLRPRPRRPPCRPAVGSFGDAGCFSFYPTKVLGAFGDGGICVTRDRALPDRLRRCACTASTTSRSARRRGRQQPPGRVAGGDPPGEAAPPRRDLAERRAWPIVTSRPCRFDSFCTPPATHDVEHAYHLFVSLSPPDREAAIRALEEAQIGHGLHYPHPAHRMEPTVPGLPRGQSAGNRARLRPGALPSALPGLPAEAVDRVAASPRWSRA